MAEDSGERRTEQAPGREEGSRSSWLGNAGSHVLVGVVLFFVALIPRLNAIWRGFITPDEPIWVFRAYRFLQAVEGHRWADTFQMGHPGVTTMWMGALGILWQRWRDAAGTAIHLSWIDRVAWVTPTNEELFRHLAPFLPSARLAMAVLASLGVVGVFALACRLWDRRTAIVAAVLLAFSPFAVALSGLLHVDAPAMTFMILCLLAWLNALDEGHESGILVQGLFALCAGLCAGLGVLSKSPAAFIVVPVSVAALLAFLLSPSRRCLATIAGLGAIWAAGAAIALFGAFPAMWVDPLGVLRDIYGLADRHLDIAHRISFFRGIAGGDPGPAFYPTVFLYRLMPVTLVGLVLALLPTLTGWRSREANRRRVSLISLWVYAVGFGAFITVGAKKFDRYLLPAFPALILLAAVGWVEALRWLYARAQRRSGTGRAEEAQTESAPAGWLPSEAFATVLIVLAVVQAATVSLAWPYYLDVYNPLVGGLGAALRMFPVGWGEGLEQMASYLGSRSEGIEEDLVVAGASPVTLSPLYDGTVLILDDASRLLADKLIVTAADRQVYPERVAELISGARLEHVVRIGGQEMLWLYDTDDQAEADLLTRYVAPGDVVVCDAPSPSCRHATGENIYLLAGADEAEVVERLNDWSESRWRLWYLAYPSDGEKPVASPITALALRRQLDEHAIALDEIDLGHATATLYILPEEPAFAVRDLSEPMSGRQGSLSQLAALPSFQPATYGGRLGVVGGTLLGEAVAADDRVRLRLRWRALSTPEADYAPFVHLVDQAGHLRTAGRGEELLVDARGWPTSAWEPGTEVELNYGVGFPKGLPPGVYSVVVGLADPQGGWLPVLDHQGRMLGTTAPLLSVNVLPAEEPPAPEELRLPHAMDVSWGDLIVLLGYDYPGKARGGSTIVVDLGWLALEPLDGDFAMRLRLIQPDGTAAHESRYALSDYATSRWRQGELIRELYDLALPAELEGSEYGLTVQVYEEGGTPMGPPVELGTLTVSVEDRLYELERPPQFPLDVRLGEGITLLGYDLPQRTVQPGDRLPVTLYWQCAAPVETSYTVFVHLLDAAGQVQGQRDRIPVRGRAPTSGWVRDQFVVDEYAIPVSESVEPGPYVLEVGMYNAEDMVRLPVYDANGVRMSDDRILLPAEVTVDAR